MVSPIETRSVREQVYDQLHAWIFDGTWSPGTRVDPNKVAAEFGVSKTPVQEAIQKLTAEGVLTVKPRSGTYVTEFDLEEMADLFQFRLALETGAAKAIIAGVTPQLLGALQKATAAMQDALATSEKDARPTFLKLDAEFHNAIMSASGNSVIAQYYGRVNTLSFSSRQRRRFDRADFEATLVDHAQILSALVARDVTAFRAASVRHVENAIAKIRRVSALVD